MGLYLAPALRAVRTATGTNRRDLAELNSRYQLPDIPLLQSKDGTMGPVVLRRSKAWEQNGASMKPSLSRLAVKIVFVLFFLFLFTDIGQQLASLALVLDHCGGVYAAMIKRQSQLLF